MKRRLVQITAGAARGDAVTNYVRHLDGYLASSGFFSSTRIYAENIAEDLPGRIAHVCTYTPSPRDVLIYHHSVGFRHLSSVLFPHVRPLLIYHNITPAHFYAPWDFRAAGRMELGRMQLPVLAGVSPKAIALSEFSAGELRAAGFKRVDVLPYPRGATMLSRSVRRQSAPSSVAGPYRVLFVGRIAPNKRIELLLDVFGRLRRTMERAGEKVELVVAGAMKSDRYSDYIRQLCVRMGMSDHVVWTGYVDDESLVRLWAGASLFLSLSEHEGFGVPLVEAMGMEVPILALCAAQSSVAEVLGGSGVGFRCVTAEWVADCARRMLVDPSLREAVILGQRKRLAELDSVDVGARVREIVGEMIHDG